MCPFCLATVGLIVAGTASTGGMAVLAVRLSRKNKAKEIIPNPTGKDDHRSTQRYVPLGKTKPQGREC